MCGIAGIYCSSIASNKDNFHHFLKEMGKSIYHRGPDSDGVWLHSKHPMGFVHRRLSILDLSETGAQPMVSSNQRFVITFNGEIYNFQQIKDELLKSGASFRGSSDTEVLLEAIVYFGLEKTLKLINGMFAFALWDNEEDELILVRDHVGQKPLYFGWIGNSFAFASELKAIKGIPHFKKVINPNAVQLFFKYNYIPTPYSIYQDIFKLAPGSYIKLSLENLHNMNSMDVFNSFQYYWKAKDHFLSENLHSKSEEELTEDLEELLSQVLKEQMFTDVPYGAFLSGGIDSSLTTALMQKQSSKPIKTFSIGFNEKDFNEAHHAKSVADHLGTDHTELYLTSKDSYEVIPSLAKMYDEPFSDSSQIPTFLVSKLARKDVTVCLSGDGGDELFAGYNRYLWTEKIHNTSSKIPSFLKSIISNQSLAPSPESFEKLFFGIHPLLPNKLKFKNPGNKYQKVLNLLSAKSINESYDKLISHWADKESIFIGDIVDRKLCDYHINNKKVSNIENMMFLDVVNYMMDDILVKVDRASMANSLEVRVPLIDNRIIEYSSRIPLSLKIKNNQQKYILRQILYKYVPSSLIDRPKSGFGIPVGHWIKNDLKDWAQDLLNPVKIKNDNLLNNDLIQKKWKHHLSSKGDHQYDLWDVLMFQAWLREYQ